MVLDWLWKAKERKRVRGVRGAQEKPYHHQFEQGHQEKSCFRGKDEDEPSFRQIELKKPF